MRSDGASGAPRPPSSAVAKSLPLWTLLALEAGLVGSWSSGFIGVRFAIDYAPLFTVLLWRTLVSGLVLLPWVLWRGPRMRGRDMAAQMLVGLFAMAAYLGLYAQAIALGAPTGVVALITDLLPLAVALLSWPVLGQRLLPRQWVGTWLGLAGVLVASGLVTSATQAPPWAYALPLLGTLALALATLKLRTEPSSHMPVAQQLCIQCLTSALVFAPLAAAQGQVLPPMEWEFALGIVWLVLVPTYAAWGLYYLALRRSSAARVTSVLYLSPPLTMVWAWMAFDEPLSWNMLVGLLLALAGIVVFVRAKPPI